MLTAYTTDPVTEAYAILERMKNEGRIEEFVAAFNGELTDQARESGRRLRAVAKETAK